MGHGVIVSQPADGRAYRWFLGNAGARRGSEVLVPVLLDLNPDGPPPSNGINISNVYTYINYQEADFPDLQGDIVTVHDITITPTEGSPLVAYRIQWETIPP
jgi:hypothetical protein